MMLLRMTSEEEADPNKTTARRIVVAGDMGGGYYCSCITNEAKRFRKLSGTMSPPDNSGHAEIYVGGKHKSIESFPRWCKRSNVGLPQSIKVQEVIDKFPTGLYEDFYVDTGRDAEVGDKKK